ncbi:cysteine desulfuration protein SufE [Geopseudomonas sagittaria]|uniref:Cysteine desulfuration protein SufE n=1 Tax=Geopseudomonas sagittaria TaxID=1135990 RepID=A0A1I5Z2W5_9GAMM|nr:SufE family protein [Pseudomonas sagittaria]MCM2331083.1 SufE family protein [Pseudomonas sagittaria]SFQ50808.1 cysteine desulfuration protein SufE [Pseudomonas sagittaria]
MSLPETARQALADFAHCPGWEQRARLLMQWGERLAPLREDERCEENRVHGCESSVWLVAGHDGERLSFRAGSDARLLRGLLALLLVRVNGLSAKELAEVDVADWFAQLGLARQLSPSRSNGLNAVLTRIRELA